MKKIIPTFFLIAISLTMLGILFIPQQAEASWWCVFNPTLCVVNNVVDSAAKNVLMSLAADFGNLIIWIASWFLTVTGLLLNISIVLTMNIKAIYQATPAIDQVWIVIRNISSIFIIFGLLYTSIMTILDVGKANIKSLIGKIVLAGLLINFSLFFTKVLIDGSNLISLQFYRAIAPQSQNTILSGNIDATELVKGSYYDGGISNIFQQSLKLPSIYNNKKGLIAADNDQNFFTIAVSTISGSVLMIFAALSFLAAAIAFIIRIVVLLLLMGFSPIYFVGMIFPQIEQQVSKKWEGWLIQELLFMPAYLLFMYVAMSFISSGNGTSFFEALDRARQGLGNEATAGVLLSTVGLILQYTIAFILINIPLFAALQLGGTGVKWGDSAKKWVGGYIGKNSVGKAAFNLEKKIEDKKWANSQPMRDLRSMTSQKLSGSKFGGSTSYKDDNKEEKDKKQKLREIGNAERLNTVLSTGSANDIKNELAKMSSSEIAKLDKKHLTNEKVIRHLSSSTYANIEKSDKKDEDKALIAAARIKALDDAVIKKDNDAAKSIIDNMTSDELQDYIKEKYTGVVIDPIVLGSIKEGKLKDMSTLSDDHRRQVKDSISNRESVGKEKDLTEALAAPSDPVTNKRIRSMINNMSGDDLQSYIETNTPAGGTIKSELIKNIKEKQLKDMETMNDRLKRQIGREIAGWSNKYGEKHQADRFLNDPINNQNWT